jgi:hypothetical protein
VRVRVRVGVRVKVRVRVWVRRIKGRIYRLPVNAIIKASLVKVETHGNVLLHSAADGERSLGHVAHAVHHGDVPTFPAHVAH